MPGLQLPRHVSFYISILIVLLNVPSPSKKAEPNKHRHTNDIAGQAVAAGRKQSRHHGQTDPPPAITRGRRRTLGLRATHMEDCHGYAAAGRLIRYRIRCLCPA